MDQASGHKFSYIRGPDFILMNSIQMVDLLGQYQHIQEEIDEAVLSVLRSSAFINGPEVQAFKDELGAFLDVKHVIPCGNGTDALQLALMSLDLKPGDEVITPSFTYIATAEAICLLGLTPVFVDVNPDTFNLDVNELESVISSKTKAIIGVHLYGQSFDFDAVAEIAEKHGIPIIEDAAQSMGGTYKGKKTGSLAQLGCTSFFPSKNLGGYGDGGALFTNDDALADKVAKLANHGQRKRYYHQYIGINSRLDSIQAAILRVKLKHLNNYNASRINAANRYDVLFENEDRITIPVRSEFGQHVFHQYTIKVPAELRDGLASFLSEKNIPCNIYYPVAIHQQESFTGHGYRSGNLSVTESLTKVVLSLPMHTELTLEQQEFITTSVVEYLRKNG